MEPQSFIRARLMRGGIRRRRSSSEPRLDPDSAVLGTALHLYLDRKKTPEERLARLGLLLTTEHFIDAELRPDLARSAEIDAPDLEDVGSDPAAA